MDYAKRYKEGISHLTDLVVKNQLIHTSEVLYGINSAPTGLARLISGKNTGKVIIKCDGENAKPSL